MRGITLLYTLLTWSAAVFAYENACLRTDNEQLLRHEDCNKYYKCASGQMLEYRCNGDLFFNLETLQCERPNYVDCGGRNIPEQTSEVSSPESSASGSVKLKRTSRSTQFQSNGCPVNPHIHWLLPHESNCSLFYYCVWGDLVLRECAPGTHFNRVLQVCDWPRDANCSTTSQTTSSTPATTSITTSESSTNVTTSQSPDIDSTTAQQTTPGLEFLPNGCPVNPHTHWLLPHETNCSLFYYCVWGDLVLRECPIGLHFNKNIQVCDWPRDACCLSEPTTPKLTTLDPVTAEPTTPEPKTPEPVTTEPTTSESESTTPNQTTPKITTTEPTTPEPTTPEPTTPEKTTPEITTSKPITLEPTTNEPSTPEPTTSEKTTPEITTPEPTTADPTTLEPATPEPTTPENTTSKTTTVKPTEEPTTPGLEFLPNGCPVNPHTHWLLPHENNCSLFYYCVWGDLVLRECAPGTHFNRVLQVCDWPRDANCSSTSQTTSSTPATTSITTSDSSTDITTSQSPDTDSTTAQQTTPELEFLPNGCPVNPHIHWLLPHETNCSLFYYCVWGDLVLRECPIGLHFNNKIQVCDWPQSASCLLEPTTSKPTTVNPTTAKPTAPEPTTSEEITTEITDSTTLQPTKPEPTTPEPTTSETTTKEPTTPEITTPERTTLEPTATEPTTPELTTSEETTPEITTSEPTTPERTTLEPTKSEPITPEPTTSEPITPEPTTPEPTTPEPITPEPTTSEPITPEPTTPEPTTPEPTTPEPATPESTTSEPTTPKPTVEPTTPGLDLLPNGCPVDPHIHWLLPHENNCSLFYYCVWGDLVLRECAPGTHFNRVLQVCDWPRDANCSTSQATSSTPASTSITTSESSTNTSQPSEPDLTTAQPELEFLPNGCPVNPHIHWLLPHETDCTMFYYCVWGDLILRQCAPGTNFNRVLQVCDWPRDAGCTTALNKHGDARRALLSLI